MQIIPPVDVSDFNLTSSNIPENDAQVWTNNATYGAGETVLYLHNVYESLEAANTGNLPDQSPHQWLLLGASNRYKAFDRRISDPAVKADEVSYTISHGGLAINSVSAFGLEAASIKVEINDPNDGLVYSNTVDLIDNSAVIDWFTYFFAPIGLKTLEVVLTDLPPYGTASTTVTVSNPGLDAKVGQIALGQAIELGIVLYGTSISIEDYSRKERDPFGNAVIVERGFAQTVDFDLKVPTLGARRVQNLLAKYRTTPVVWNGTKDASYGVNVYGYYRRFDINLSAPQVSDATIEVEGLI